MEKMKTLEEIISKAFDEGADSPYDLKDDIVSSLVDETGHLGHQTNKIEKFKERAQKHISIPSLLLSLMKLNHGNVWLAGGAILYKLIKPTYHVDKAWQNRDFDLFCNPEGHVRLKSQLNKLNKNNVPTYNNEKYKNTFDKQFGSIERYKINGLSKTVNVIVGDFENINTIFESFDLTICQIAIKYTIKDSKWKQIVYAYY